MSIEASQLVASSDAAASEAAPAPASRSRPARRPAPEITVREAPAQSAVSQTPEHSLSVRVDQLRRVYYEVINDRTGEVVRQIPPEEIRRVAASIAELLQAAQAGKSVDVHS